MKTYRLACGPVGRDDPGRVGLRPGTDARRRGRAAASRRRRQAPALKPCASVVGRSADGPDPGQVQGGPAGLPGRAADRRRPGSQPRRPGRSRPTRRAPRRRPSPVRAARSGTRRGFRRRRRYRDHAAQPHRAVLPGQEDRLHERGAAKRRRPLRGQGHHRHRRPRHAAGQAGRTDARRNRHQGAGRRHRRWCSPAASATRSSSTRS